MISHNDSSQKALTKNLSVSYVQPITPDTVYTITANKSSNSEIKVIISDTERNEVSIGIAEIVFK